MVASRDEDEEQDEDEEEEEEKGGYGETWVLPCCVLRRRWPTAKKAVVGVERRSRTRRRRQRTGRGVVASWSR